MMNAEYKGNYQKIMIITVSDGGTKCERNDKIFESFFIIVELKCAMFDHQTVKNVCVMFVRPKNFVDFWLMTALLWDHHFFLLVGWYAFYISQRQVTCRNKKEK